MSAARSEAESPAVHFAGPSHPRGQLRDLLEERIERVPQGGAIDWVCYYFRDRRLAAALLRARRRGVDVRVSVDGLPRTAHANAVVSTMLSPAEALGEGFREIVHPRIPIPGRRESRAHLHAKLYCFSAPRPFALIGSFNPSGDGEDDDAAILEEIRDQDRGYNVLVEIRDPRLATSLAERARSIHGARHGLLERLALLRERGLRSEGFEVDFWPGSLSNPVLRALGRLRRGERLRVAASHLKGFTVPRLFARLARRGVAVEILAEETRRRVPDRVSHELAAAGASIQRVAHREGFPMHDKFALLDTSGDRIVLFGSFSWTERSFRLNHEISVLCRDPEVYRAFAERWDELRASARG